MPTASGYTTFGIIRKRMADLYSDFATRIKEGGVFGTQTTADLPDTFPADPLVQIMTTTTGSLHELWEAVELYFAQFDYRSATGAALENLHGLPLGIAKTIGQADEEYRVLIGNALARPTRADIRTIATARPDIECVSLIFSSIEKPVPRIPAPGYALVVKGCPTLPALSIDYDALVGEIYNSVDLGVHQFYGDKVGAYQIPNGGGCYTLNFFAAQPLYAALDVQGYYETVCAGTTPGTVADTIVARLAGFTSQCSLGSALTSAAVLQTLAGIPGFVVTGVKLGRRARQLWPNGCDLTDAPKVLVCGALTPWASSQLCGPGSGEVWCAPDALCLNVEPWEFIAFDKQFITVTDDATRGGCS